MYQFIFKIVLMFLLKTFNTVYTELSCILFLYKYWNK